MEGIKPKFTAHEGEAKVLSSEELAEAAKGLETVEDTVSTAPERMEANPAIEAAELSATETVRERLARHGEMTVQAPKPPEITSERPRQALGAERSVVEKREKGEMNPTELIAEMGLPERLGKDKFNRPKSEFLNRIRQGERPSEVLQGALQQEQRANGEKRTKFGMASIMTGLGAGTLSLGAGVASAWAGVGAVTLGTIAMPAIGVGALGLGVLGGAGLAIGGAGWLGMKAYHSIKEGRHKQAYRKLFSYSH